MYIFHHDLYMYIFHYDPYMYIFHHDPYMYIFHYDPYMYIFHYDPSVYTLHYDPSVYTLHYDPSVYTLHYDLSMYTFHYYAIFKISALLFFTYVHQFRPRIIIQTINMRDAIVGIGIHLEHVPKCVSLSGCMIWICVCIIYHNHQSNVFMKPLTLKYYNKKKMELDLFLSFH